jgi:hypothetical protein
VPNRRVIAKLLHRPALESLRISEARDRLDGIDAAVAIKHDIPGAQVAGPSHHTLDVPGDGRGHAHMGPIQEADLPRVAQWVAGGKRPHRVSQPDRGMEPADLPDGHVRYLAADQPPDLASRHAHGPTDVGHAEAKSESRGIELPHRFVDDGSSVRIGSLKPGGPGGHAHHHGEGRFTATYLAVLLPPPAGQAVSTGPTCPPGVHTDG